MAFVVRLKARFRHGERRPRSDRPLTAPQTRVRRSHSGFASAIRCRAYPPAPARLGDGRRQAARFKAGEGRLGSQDRNNPAPDVD
jgi:hypothetical protein